MSRPSFLSYVSAKVIPSPSFSDVASSGFVDSDELSGGHQTEDALVSSDEDCFASSAGSASFCVSERLHWARSKVVYIAIEKLTESNITCAAVEEVGPDLWVHISPWYLEFQDAQLENLFRLHVVAQLGRTTVWAYALVVLYGVYSLYGSVLSGDNMLVFNWDTVPNAMYNFSWLALIIVALALTTETCITRGQKHRRAGREARTSIFFGLALWIRCFLGNRLRAAEIFGAESLDVFGTSDTGDDELLLHTFALVTFLGIRSHMRFKLLLFPWISAVLAYPVSTFMTPTGRNSGARQVINTAMLALVTAFIFMFERQIEVTRRRALLNSINCEARALLLKEEQEHSRAQAAVIRSCKKGQRAIFAAVEQASFNRGHSPGSASPVARRAHTRHDTKEDPLPPGDVDVSSQRVDTLHSLASESMLGTYAKFEEFSDLAVAHAMPAAETDWAALDTAVERIRDPSYSLKEFHDHMVQAFPELGLYTYKVTSSPQESGDYSDDLLTSGRTRSEELARTFGAFYALYWLMRLDLEGKQGFCFGYDDEWNLQPVPESATIDELRQKKPASCSYVEKQILFYHTFPWAECEKLLASAGILPRGETSGGDGDAPQAAPTVGHDRFKTMLVLTAIHDVMKNEALCPKVRPTHSPFGNYKDGEVILDHDIALDYILCYYGQFLPSYHGLDEASKRLVRFTQGKMGFNNGWLVQGEAPPGALFHTFKQLIQSGSAESEDVAFYFAHWVTDLAGAEPTPLRGSEKFVQKFPGSVLTSFFRSFPYVWQLSDLTETQVFQNYLRAQWVQNPLLGAPPTGEDAVALMRIALQAQGHADAARAAFHQLRPKDRHTLIAEMSRTGLASQYYEGVEPKHGCPALLVYYAPAFLQMNADYLRDALEVLAEVYRQGRRLFPLQSETTFEAADESAGGPNSHGCGIHTVTLRIEELKDTLAPELGGIKSRQMDELEALFLVRRNDLEATVERRPLAVINTFVEEGTSFAYLDVSGKEPFLQALRTPTHSNQGLLGGAKRTESFRGAADKQAARRAPSRLMRASTPTSSC